jgi:hypothetical protein
MKVSINRYKTRKEMAIEYTGIRLDEEGYRLYGCCLNVIIFIPVNNRIDSHVSMVMVGMTNDKPAVVHETTNR